MIHFKSEHGFSLIEIIVVLAIMALLAPQLLFQQSTLLRNVDTVSRNAERILAARSFLYECRAKMQSYSTTFKDTKIVADGDMTLQFSREPVDRRSAFAEQQNIYQDRVTIVWKEDGQERSDELVTFVYVRPQPQEAA